MAQIQGSYIWAPRNKTPSVGSQSALFGEELKEREREKEVGEKQKNERWRNET